MNQSENKLKLVIAPFVESSKTMAINIADQSHVVRYIDTAALQASVQFTLFQVEDCLS